MTLCSEVTSTGSVPLEFLLILQRHEVPTSHLIHEVVLTAVALGDLSLVQGVPDGLVGHLGMAGDA